MCVVVIKTVDDEKTGENILLKSIMISMKPAWSLPVPLAAKLWPLP